MTLLISAGFAGGLLLGLTVDPDTQMALSSMQSRLRAFVFRLRTGGDARGTRPAWSKPGVSDWPLYAGSFDASRYSPLHAIRADNVRHLTLAWIHQAGVPVEKQVATPVMVAGTLYYPVPPNLVVAVNARTGVERWRYQHRLRRAPPMCCGASSRGVAVLGDRVYYAALDARLVALDRATGQVLWDVGVADPGEGYSQTIAPLPVDGKIIVGVSGSEFGIRGFVDAYDAVTGKRVWRFYTIPTPEEGGWWGSWSATTPDGDPLDRDLAREKRDSARYAEAWRHGGGGVWMTPSYDPELRLLYLGTGNPSPAYDGRVRPGDNLYTSSLVAIDIDSGRHRWHYQFVPHDMADRDAASTIVLFDVPDGDSLIPALAQANKTGWVYVLDRRTGKRLLRSRPFVPQHDMFRAPTEDGIVTYPTNAGGNQWMPPAFSPRTGYLYVLGRHEPSLVTMGRNLPLRSPATTHGTVVRVPDPVDPERRWDTFSAVDLMTGEIAWQRREAKSVRGSGVLATGGDLVFYGKAGTVRAVDAHNGQTLWTFRAGAAVDGPPITYELDQQQYVAVLAGPSLLAFKLPAR